jgi:hypothetical protein
MSGRVTDDMVEAACKGGDFADRKGMRAALEAALEVASGAAGEWTDEDCERAINAVVGLRERGVLTDGAIAAAVMEALAVEPAQEPTPDGDDWSNGLPDVRADVLTLDERHAVEALRSVQVLDPDPVDVQMVTIIDRITARVTEHENDLRLAAGELMIEMPAPGTDMARCMLAGRMMRNERNDLRDRVRELEASLQTFCEGNAELRDQQRAVRAVIAEMDTYCSDGACTYMDRYWMRRLEAALKGEGERLTREVGESADKQ